MEVGTEGGQGVGARTSEPERINKLDCCCCCAPLHRMKQFTGERLIIAVTTPASSLMVGGWMDGWKEGCCSEVSIYRVDILHPLIIISCEGATKNKEGVEEKWPPAERGCGWSEGQSASQSLGAK